MALLNAVVLTSKTIKGGRNKVRISVSHNGETRYIVTDIILDSNKEFKNGKVVKRADAAMLNTKIRNLLHRYQSALDELEYINGLTAPELVYQLMNCHYFFDVNMPKLAEATGIKQLIYYSARKSFSQHAFDLGISTSIIDFILGHRVDKGSTSLYAYITVTPEMATNAVRQVLDNLK